MKKKSKKILEKLEATGQESEDRAVKDVLKVQKEEEENEAKEKSITEEILEKKRKYASDGYVVEFIRECSRRMLLADVPKGFRWGIKRMGKLEVAMFMERPNGKVYATGVKVSGEVKYDLNWIDRTIVKALDLMDQEQVYV